MDSDHPEAALQPEVSLFNAFNNLAAYPFRSYNYGTSWYCQPSTTLLPRTLRFGCRRSGEEMQALGFGL